MTPGPIDTTADQLDRLFEGELARWRTHLEDVALVARRHGRTDDPTEAEFDIEMGWAYRILQYWGPTRPLSFDTTCPARALLVKQGLAEAAICRIAESVGSEAKICRSQVFEAQIVALMGQSGMPDTIPNRERAKIEWFRTRADALLDVGSRWQIAATPALADTALAAAATVAIDMCPIQEPPSTAATPESKASTGHSRSSAIDLPIERFVEEGAQVITNRRDSWSDATRSDFSAFLRIFIDLLKENGVHGSKDIGQVHIGKFREFLNEIPTRYGQSSRLRAMTPAQLRSESEKLLKAAPSGKATGFDGQQKVGKVGLSALTVRKHFGNLSTFVNHLRARGFAIAEFELDALRPRKPSKASVRKKQYKQNPSDLVHVFETPIHMGCAGPDDLASSGHKIYHCALYWVPLFLVYLGARRNEICGLAVGDVHLNSTTPYISIAPNAARRIKNEQSERDLPIPSEVMRLGFQAYYEAICASGAQYLFPELYSEFKKKNDPDDRFYKEFVPIAKSTLGTLAWGRFIHALRHGFSNTARNSQIDSTVIDDVTGRLGVTETGTRYTDPAHVALLQRAIEKIPLVTSHLSPQPIKLLPWVAAGDPAPWTLKKGPAFAATAKMAKSTIRKVGKDR